MRTNIVGILLTLCASAFAYGQANTCLDCGPLITCINDSNCKCICVIVTLHGQKVCLSGGGPCILGKCIQAPESKAPALAAHPWATDTAAVEAIRVQSRAMGAAFEVAQYAIREKHLTDAFRKDEHIGERGRRERSDPVRPHREN